MNEYCTYCPWKDEIGGEFWCANIYSFKLDSCERAKKRLEMEKRIEKFSNSLNNSKDEEEHL